MTDNYVHHACKSRQNATNAYVRLLQRYKLPLNDIDTNTRKDQKQTRKILGGNTYGQMLSLELGPGISACGTACILTLGVSSLSPFQSSNEAVRALCLLDFEREA
jgi:hypothetical protein